MHTQTLFKQDYLSAQYAESNCTPNICTVDGQFAQDKKCVSSLTTISEILQNPHNKNMLSH